MSFPFRVIFPVVHLLILFLLLLLLLLKSHLKAPEHHSFSKSTEHASVNNTQKVENDIYNIYIYI